MDLHDISRTAKTFGVRGYFLVTPIEDQHELVGRILTHWKSERSRKWHPDRAVALDLTELVRDFSEVKAKITAETGICPEVVLTDARQLKGAVSYESYRKELFREDRKTPSLIVFGTGWGVHETFLSEVDVVLNPIWGPHGKEGYNHLSVRAAAAVILDRLLGA